MTKLCMTFDTGDIAAPHDAAALQAEFREQHAGVFDALQRSMDIASTSGEPVPDCIRQVSMWTLNLTPSPDNIYYFLRKGIHLGDTYSGTFACKVLWIQTLSWSSLHHFAELIHEQQPSSKHGAEMHVILAGLVDFWAHQKSS